MKIILLAIFICFTHLCSAQLNLLKVASTKANELLTSSSLNKDEVAKGLREALVIGTEYASRSASSRGGFLNNKVIRIPFPSDAEKMKIALQKAAMQSQIVAFEKSINSAAELASKETSIIFLDAIRNMTIKDAFKILEGDDDAATTYLRKQTTAQLYVKIKPIISNAIQQVEVSKYWAPLVRYYNAIPFTSAINTDLEDYVTNKTIEGLFILIAYQEEKIRNQPEARVSALLQRVFK